MDSSAGRRRPRRFSGGATPVGGESQDRRAARAIELFQLAFIEVATTELPPSHYALKGGGNLRFFLRSRRRSRDLDLDYLGARFDHFALRLERVFASRALAELLRVREIQLRQPRRAKDTDTVKRWKVPLAAPGMEETWSKIEVSAREVRHEPAFERIDADLARRLRGRAVSLHHYPPVAAIEQKVHALAQRGETQPRDVFDLDHLFREFPEAFAQAQLEPGLTRTAVSRAWELKYDDYLKLVVEYLEEAFVPLYGGEEAWTEIVQRVTTQLEARQKKEKR